MQYAQEHKIVVNETYFCPCVCSLNQICQDLGTMCDHLFIFGIMRSYMVWTCRGEVLHKPMVSQGTYYMDESMSDHLENIVSDVVEENFGKSHLYDSLKSNSKENLYPGCVNFT